MIAALLAAVTIATHSPPQHVADVAILNDANRALQAGRVEQAKLMIARAVGQGFSGVPIDRLVAGVAFASGEYEQALPIYDRLASSIHRQPGDCEKGALSALRLGRTAAAKRLTSCAVQDAGASWRAWNARGVLADRMQDWDMADEAYQQASRLAPDEADIINNEGWSKLVRGDWASAVELFEQASALDKGSARIANNLELARAALSSQLPVRRPGESDRDWAARLNDAGVAAELLGDSQRAVAAFTQALEASPVWYERASNNLQAASTN